MKHIIILLFTLSFQYNATYGNISPEKFDSISQHINELPNDSVKVKKYLKQGADLLRTSPDTALIFFNLGLEIAESIDCKSCMAMAYNDVGTVHYEKGDYDNALNYFLKADEQAPYISDYDLLGNSLNNIGIIYFMKGKTDDCIKFLMKGLDFRKKAGDNRSVAGSLNSLGYVYHTIGEYNSSLEYYDKVIALLDTSAGEDKIENLSTLMTCYNNIGMAYHKLNKKDSSEIFYVKCLILAKRLNVPSQLATALNNLGFLLHDLGRYNEALEYYEKCAEVKEKFGYRKGLATVLNNIGAIYRDKKEEARGIPFSNKSFDICDSLGSIDCMMSTSHTLSQLYEGMNDHKNALKYHKIFLKMKDSLFTESKSKEIGKLEAEFEYKNQKVLDDAENQKKIAIEKEKQEKQFYIIIMTVTGAAIVVILLLIIYRRLQITKKQKVIIEEQKEEVESQRDLIEKQKEVVEEAHQEIKDSIVYAKRIQNAILPPSTLTNQSIPNSFILYKPKDVVAGDFYWLQQIGQIILFAAADCTGHGVPGAMVSVVCNNALNRSVREYKLSDPGKILDKTREIVLEELSKSEEDVKDGMDIALCSLDGNKLAYAGAHNPLWIIRNGEILETKADKQPVGKFENSTYFTTHQIELQEGDMIYLFSDGYVDQFGGPDDKKFGSRRFKELLLSIQDMSMKEQNDFLDATLNAWMNEAGSEQLDDICVIGIRV